MVFAYGTLRDKNFLKTLLKREIKTIPAILEGFKRHKLKHRHYPLAIKAKDSSIRGRLLLDLIPEDLKKIDEWEKTPENLYRRVKASIKTHQGIKRAYVYVANQIGSRHRLGEKCSIKNL